MKFLILQLEDNISKLFKSAKSFKPLHTGTKHIEQSYASAGPVPSRMSCTRGMRTNGHANTVINSMASQKTEISISRLKQK